MTKLHKSNLSKLCQIFGLTLILSSAVSNVVAEESDFYIFPTGEQEGGGVRGVDTSCNRNAAYPIPLVPQNYQTLTTSASPKFFFDASQVDRPVALDFLMLDRNNEIVHQNLLEVDRDSEIISLNISDRDSSNQLEIDNSYHWYLVQNCGDLSVPNILASGSLQRIELQEKLALKLDAASTVDKINIYQEANMWHEAVENMTQLECGLSNTSLVDRVTDAVNTSSQLADSSIGDRCLVSQH